MARRTGYVERRVWPSGRVTWRAQWRDVTGKKQSATRDTQAEANALLAERAVEMYRGGSGAMAGRRVTLAEWWARWQASRQVGPLTARREQSAWECWISPHLGAVRLADLRRSTVQEWVAGQVRSGLAPLTVKRHVGILRACLSAAVLDELLIANPAAKVSLPRPPKVEQRFLSVAEVHRFHTAVRPKYRSMVAVGVSCGLRIGELVALQVGDINFLGKVITVRRTALGDTGQVGPVKSRSGQGRVVPVPDGVIENLRHELAGRLPAAPVWPAQDGQAWRPETWRRAVWRPAVVRADLVPPPTPHAMRHTAVAQWLDKGNDLYRVSRWAGHASTRTTEEVYGHLLVHRRVQLFSRETYAAAGITFPW